MGIFLKITLTSIFIGLAVLTYLHPTTSKEYVEKRYTAFHNSLGNCSCAAYIPKNLISNATPLAIHISAGVFATTGLLCLIGMNCLFTFLSSIIISLAAMLHGSMLCSKSNAGLNESEYAGEVKKLVFLGALFSAVLINGCSNCSCHCCKNAKKEADKEKKE